MNQPSKGLAPDGQTVGIGILSWRGAKSLRSALESYQEADLFSLFDEVLVFLPDPDKDVIAVAQDYPVRIVTHSENLGIAGGMEAVATNLKTDFVILLENDAPLIETREEAARQITKGCQLIEQGDAVSVLYRHRSQPGQTFQSDVKYLRYFDRGLMPWLRRTLRPLKARRLTGKSMFVEANPAKRHPKYIKEAGDGFYLISTRVTPWINLGMMIKREVFLGTIMPYVNSAPTKRRINGFRNLEIELNDSPFWTQSGWYMASSPGLFTHERVEYRGY